MKITFNPAVLNAPSVRPIARVARRPASLPADELPLRPEGAADPVKLSSEGRALAEEEADFAQDGRRRKPAWTMMVNLARLSERGD